MRWRTLLLNILIFFLCSTRSEILFPCEEKIMTIKSNQNGNEWKSCLLLSTTTFCTHAAFISTLCCLCFVECKNLCIVKRVKFLEFSQFFTHFTCEGCWVKYTNKSWTDEKFLGFCFKVFLGCMMYVHTYFFLEKDENVLMLSEEDRSGKRRR